jgi:hypothetical protein
MCDRKAVSPAHPRFVHDTNMTTYSLTRFDRTHFSILSAAGFPVCICFLGGGIGGAILLLLSKMPGK